jgi:hypothetical protein
VTGQGHEARLLYLTLNTDTGEARFVDAGRMEGALRLTAGDTLLLSTRGGPELVPAQGPDPLKDVCARILARGDDDVCLLGVRLSPVLSGSLT